ncbi:hypothetical protein LCGC14_0019440 [marine sediment metagenome]|uniref:Enoyl reductase (ER) domain-containing protein n=1 Tax=marine sediment metagenome TaxID=412755 RepID=A0A0F9WG74_9ZZZZ|nr:hypothetical protein [Phycisphaerae bacterium]HDZ44530.1 hypothetical protein [Phycisphaerae bacterium]
MRGVKILEGPNVAVCDWPDPSPEGDEVVVRIEAAGLCGTDLHCLYEKDWACPSIPGHEGAGTVVAVDKPRRLKEGDRVFMMAFSTCETCGPCKAGYFVYCRDANTSMHGFSRDGFQAEYVRIKENQCLLLREHVTFEHGAVLQDPIGTPFHAIKRMGVEAGHVVGVFGLGPMGLGAVMIAAQKGCRVIGVEPIAFRRDLAMTLGAADVVDPAAGDIAEQIRELTGGEGLDRVLECCGRAEVLSAALDLAKPFGHVAIIGECDEATIQPSGHFNRKEVTLSGSTVFPMGEYDEITQLFADGLPTDRFITHRFPIERAEEAYETFAAGQTGKVLFTPTVT